mgnify:CR=1 FL=1
MPRCDWCGDDPIYVAYHDKEWGVPEHRDRALYEKLCLDGFQAGLSWIIVLKKRKRLRLAFDNFNPEKVARFGAREINRLLKDASIIRSRAKIQATIGNAQAWLAIMESGRGSFNDFLWKHVDRSPIVNHRKPTQSCATQTRQSRAMAKDLKQHGFKFVGPTICYAFMQAVGMVNDHAINCPRHKQVQMLYDK